MADLLSKPEQLALVLLYHAAFQERGGDLRSWKGYDWAIMNRLHEGGLITDPVGRAKSVFLTPDGRRRAEDLATEYLGTAAEARPSLGSMCECGLCQEPRPNGGFVPGHDQRLRTHLESRVGGLRALRTIVEAVEAYMQGHSTAEDLTCEIRALFAASEEPSNNELQRTRPAQRTEPRR